MKTKKRAKVTRHHGSHTHGRGAKKKARGKGHRGGIGMAGTGKRADHKKSKVLIKGVKYFGRSKTLRKREVVKLKVITLRTLEENIESLVSRRIAKESKGVYELNLEKYKIIGNGEIGIKLKIKAGGASASAKKMIEKAGGSVEFPEIKEFKKKAEKVEEKNEESE